MSHQLARDIRQQARLVVLLLRPPLVLLLQSFALLGLSVTGHARDLAVTVPVSVAVLGFLLTAVALNDLSDREVDRINLPGQASRPMAAGIAGTHEMLLVAGVGAVSSLGAAASLGIGPLLVAVGGLLLALTYSVKPFALSGRGAAASLVLPFGFVAVPYLTAVLATGHLTAARLLLLGGLYVGFIGRILLKDFRDVVGDTLLGKRTFLVRHGRRVTCLLSAAFWTAGSVAVLVVVKGSLVTNLSYAVQCLTVLALLRSLARSTSPRQDEAFISAIAILGRGCIAVLLGHFALVSQDALMADAIGCGLAVMSLQFAWVMARQGPTSRLRLPGSWVTPASAELLGAAMNPLTRGSKPVTRPGTVRV